MLGQTAGNSVCDGRVTKMSEEIGEKQTVTQRIIAK